MYCKYRSVRGFFRVVLSLTTFRNWRVGASAFSQDMARGKKLDGLDAA